MGFAIFTISVRGGPPCI